MATIDKCEGEYLNRAEQVFNEDYAICEICDKVCHLDDMNESETRCDECEENYTEEA